MAAATLTEPEIYLTIFLLVTTRWTHQGQQQTATTAQVAPNADDQSYVPTTPSRLVHSIVLGPSNRAVRSTSEEFLGIPAPTYSQN